MATLLMPADHHQQQQQQQRRAKKAKNGQKKQPQRGLGVAQLEKLRMQEESKKAMLGSSPGIGPPPGAHLVYHHHPQLQAAVAFQQQRGSLNLNAFHPHFLPALLKPEIDPHRHGFPPSKPPPQQQHQQQPNTDSGSCKSGLSSDKPLLCSSPSPSPCSSSQHTSNNLGAAEDDESSRASPGFFPEPPLIGSSRIKNPAGLILSSLTKDGLLLPPSPPADSDLFDPSFRTRKRVYDCRDWPPVYGVPAIKELSSFQIPGNTHPALSSVNRTRCCEGPWSGARDGVTDAPVKLIGSTSSPTSFSSWPRSEVCFSFEGTTSKDSCSSTLNQLNSINNNTNNFNPASSSSSCKPRDFLALSLATTSGAARQLADDRESCSERVVVDQEASGETEESWSHHHLQPQKYLKLMNPTPTSTPSCKLELSLNVATLDDSSLELKLAL